MSEALPLSWSNALAGWQRSMERGQIAARTIANRRRAVGRFARVHPEPFKVTADDVAHWLDHPARWSAIEPKQMSSALRTFYAWAVANGLAASNPVPAFGRARRPLSDEWTKALADYGKACRDSGHASTTVARRARHLELFATTSGEEDPWKVTAPALAAWVRAQDWQASTTAAARTALRAFYEWGVDAGRVASNPAVYLTAIRDTQDPRPIGSRGPALGHLPEPWRGPLRLFGRHLLARGQSSTTVRLRDRHLARMARDLAPLDPWSVTFDDLMDWLSMLKLDASTRRSMRASAVAFYAWALDAGHVDHDPASRLPSIRPSAPNPRPASENAIRAAVLTADARERLMIRLAAELGMRRAEIAGLRTHDLIEREGGWSLIVRGKGAKERLLPVPGSLAEALRALPPGYVFPSPTSPAGHLTPGTVGHLMGELLPPGVTAHALRHRFATRAYELDRDVFAVQRLLGHSRPETTQRYVATGDEHLRSTVERLAAWTEAQRITASGN